MAENTSNTIPPAAATPTVAKRKYGVLYVDDEETALKYFKRGLEKECPVFTANGGAAAIAILEKEATQIGVVISDQKMPGQTGVEMLTEIRKRWPNIMRILITAYSEIESAIEAVNGGAIYKYLTKPAEPPKLKAILLAALDEFAAKNDRDAVLTQRMAGLQRMVVADRVRSLAAMADGISHHLRNSMTAMSCFLEESNAAGKEKGTPAAGGDAYIDQLWNLARSERSELLTLLQSVGNASSNQPQLKWVDGVQVDNLMTTVISGIAGVTTQLPSLPPVKGDAEKLAYMFKTLCRYAGKLSGSTASGTVKITGAPVDSIWNTQGVRLTFLSSGAAWAERDVAALFTPFAFPSNDPSDLGIEMLMAFFIAHQHGGDVIVHRQAPEGPGFEVLLPLDPAAVQRPDLENHILEATLQSAA